VLVGAGGRGGLWAVEVRAGAVLRSLQLGPPVPGAAGAAWLL